MNYLEEAKQRWPNAKNIIGHGRYACIAQNGALIYLATTESQAHNIGLGVDAPKFADFVPTPCPSLPDDEDDVRYEREERRRAGKNLTRFPK